MPDLRFATPTIWVEAVLQEFDVFLLDHAAAEKKAAGMATSMLSHYPDKPDIVSAMIDLAIEEMTHFREVIKWVYQRGLTLAADQKDLYINELRRQMRKGSEVYMMDRLLIGSVVEARGCERFGLVAQALPPGPLKQFYTAITESESRHEDLFLRLARNHFAEETISARMNQLLDAEANIVASLPIRPALH